MALYIVLAVCPIVFSFFFKNLNAAEPEKRNKSRKTYLFAIGVVVFLFLALRNKKLGSTDTVNYYNMMERAIGCGSFSSYYNPDGVESGFQLFVYLLSRVFKSPQMILVVSALIYTFAVCFFVYHNSKDAALSVTMYIALGLMQFNMQGMRQSIAMSICIMAYEFVKRKKLIPFLLAVLLAVQFHRTAVVFVAVYPLVYFKFDLKSFLIFGVLACCVFAFSGRIIALANKLFDSNYHVNIDSGGYIATLIYFLIIVFSCVFDANLKHNEGIGVLYLTCLGLICYLLRYFGTLAAERISFYFMFGQIILLPNAINCFEQKSRVAIKTFAYIFIIALFAYRLMGSEFVPYRFCF